jgi:hypothetical protein
VRPELSLAGTHLFIEVRVARERGREGGREGGREREKERDIEIAVFRRREEESAGVS